MGNQISLKILQDFKFEEKKQVIHEVTVTHSCILDVGILVWNILMKEQN